MMVFGLSFSVGGMLVLLIRKLMGRFASNFWNEQNSTPKRRSEKYWTDSSTAQGLVMIGVGLLIALTSFIFR